MRGPALLSGPRERFNSADKAASITLSGGNIIATKGTANAYGAARATLSRPHTDKGYFEVYSSAGVASPYMGYGLATSSMALTILVGGDANSWGYYQETGEKYAGGTYSAYGSSWGDADVIGVAFNNGKIWFAKNNVWQNSGDPAAGTGEAFSGITGTLFPTVSLWRATAQAHVAALRLHAAHQKYAPPSGFEAWDR